MSDRPTRLVIIGGSDAGISAAVRAKELDPSADVAVLLGDDYPNYSVCGLPFLLSGEVDDWHRLAHRTRGQLDEAGIRVLTRHRVVGIDPVRKQVDVFRGDDPRTTMGYDRLVIATGAHARNPLGDAAARLAGVFSLRTVDDSLALAGYIGERKPTSVLIVGAGYIGVEMADALTRRGLDVALVGRGVLNTVDSDLGDLVLGELERRGVRVLATSVQGVSRHGDHLVVSLSVGPDQDTDLVVVAAGVEPTTELARGANVVLGETGAIAVDRSMATNVPDVFAAGDCVETWHALLRRPVYQPLGTTAHKQGRVAGENALGGTAEYVGSYGTQVVKVFDLAVARTGLSEVEARGAGLRPLTVEKRCPDRTAYYADAHELRIRLTADIDTGLIVGGQIVGDWRGQVAKRIDIIATALMSEMRVQDLDQLDLSYTPPLSTPWDPVQLAGHAWLAIASDP